MAEFTTPNPHDELNTVLYVTQYLCIPIVSLFVLMRLTIRLYYKQNFGIEDAACYSAYVLFMAYCGIAIVSMFSIFYTPVYLLTGTVAQNGGGFYSTALTDHQAVLFRKWSYIATVIYCPMALIVKIALLYILIRIFSPYKTKVILIYVFLAALCVYYIIAEIVKIRMCDPVPAYWLGTPGASCLDQQAALIADSVISVISDLIILITPLPLTWSLQMSRNKKLRVMGILSAGGLATAFSIYRLVLVVKDGRTGDENLTFTCVVLSGNAEGGVGLICACLPSANLVIAKIRQYGSSANRSYANQDSSSLPLSKMRHMGSKNASKLSKRDQDTIDYGNDQSHLISFAGANGGDAPGAVGIHKTIDVSQTVEMLDENDRNHSSHSHTQSNSHSP